MSFQNPQAMETSISMLSPEEKAHRDVEYLRDALRCVIDQRQSLLKSEQKVFDLIPARRIVNIQDHKLIENETIPKIVLMGKWLEEAGFHYNQHASIFIVQDMLLICPYDALVDKEALK